MILPFILCNCKYCLSTFIDIRHKFSCPISLTYDAISAILFIIRKRKRKYMIKEITSHSVAFMLFPLDKSLSFRPLSLQNNTAEILHIVADFLMLPGLRP